MSVALRLTRLGAKKKAFFRIIASDKACPRDGRFLDVIGYYDPVKQPAVVKIDFEKLDCWIKQGAVPSPTVASLIKSTPRPSA